MLKIIHFFGSRLYMVKTPVRNMCTKNCGITHGGSGIKDTGTDSSYKSFKSWIAACSWKPALRGYWFLWNLNLHFAVYPHSMCRCPPCCKKKKFFYCKVPYTFVNISASFEQVHIIFGYIIQTFGQQRQLSLGQNAHWRVQHIALRCRFIFCCMSIFDAYLLLLV